MRNDHHQQHRLQLPVQADGERRESGGVQAEATEKDGRLVGNFVEKLDGVSLLTRFLFNRPGTTYARNDEQESAWTRTPWRSG